MRVFLLTLFKLAIVVAVALVVLHFWPVLMVPLTLVVIAGLTASGLILGVLGVLAAITLAVLLALAPVAIPVLAIVGLVCLLRRSTAPRTTAAVG
jgi:hypothetical protein